jgi:uncharacterized protein with von Willebrand factor type A (vWA) domain
MGEVLKITKRDGTIHTAPISRKAWFENHNLKTLGAQHSWKLEVIDESEVKNLPFRIDPEKMVSDLQSEAQAKAEALTKIQAENESLKKLNEEMKAKLEGTNNKNGNK